MTKELSPQKLFLFPALWFLLYYVLPTWLAFLRLKLWSQDKSEHTKERSVHKLRVKFKPDADWNGIGGAKRTLKPERQKIRMQCFITDKAQLRIYYFTKKSWDCYCLQHAVGTCTVWLLKSTNKLSSRAQRLINLEIPVLVVRSLKSSNVELG